MTVRLVNAHSQHTVRVYREARQRPHGKSRPIRYGVNYVGNRSHYFKPYVVRSRSVEGAISDSTMHYSVA